MLIERENLYRTFAFVALFILIWIYPKIYFAWQLRTLLLGLAWGMALSPPTKWFSYESNMRILMTGAIGMALSPVYDGIMIFFLGFWCSFICFYVSLKLKYVELLLSRLIRAITATFFGILFLFLPVPQAPNAAEGARIIYSFPPFAGLVLSMIIGAYFFDYVILKIIKK